MRAIWPGGLLALLALALAAPAAAERRGVRVDGFGTWEIGEPPPVTTPEAFTLPSPLCPGWQAGSTLVQWNGYVFSGRQIAAHLTDTYCQLPVPGSLTEASFFYPDETGLASLIGTNPGDIVTAIRYSYLDAPRFDFENPPSGFQWTFYRFAAGDAVTTIVGLYGLEDVVLGHSSYVSFASVLLWDAAVDGFDGAYFCFDGNRYLGRWDGSVAQPSACLTAAKRVFRGGFG
jgi:hypothetical protein